MNVTQFAVLRAIGRHEGEPLTRVAEDLCMDRTSLYRAVATMRRNGWITVNGPTDRSRAARIAAKGKRALDAADPHWSRLQLEILNRFGRQRWSVLVEELNALAACAAAAAQETAD